MRILLAGLLFLTSVTFAAKQVTLAQPAEALDFQQINTIVALKALRDSKSPLLGGAQGVIVTGVIPGSQAVSIGIMIDDVIVSYGSTPVLNVTQLVNTIKAASRRQSIPINIVRNGLLLTLSAKSGPIGVRLLDVDDQRIQSAQSTKVFLAKQKALAQVGWTDDQGNTVTLGQQQQLTATTTTAGGLSATAKTELPREVVAGVPFDKTKFKQIPVYFENKYRGKKLAGHYTGMVNKKKLPYGWGRLKLDSGVTVVSYFKGGAARALTRVRFGNGDTSYLAFANGSSFCRAEYDYIVYDKDFLFQRNCAKGQMRYGKVPGVSYTKEVVALGDHRVGLFSYMLMEGAFKPWKAISVHDERGNGVPWRYAMYSPKNQTLDIEYSNTAKQLKYVRAFKDGRSWTGSRSYPGTGNPSFRYGGGYGYVYPLNEAAPEAVGQASYIHPLGVTLGTVKGAWEEDKIPGATLHRLKNVYPEYTGLNPEPHFVDYADGRHYQGETIKSVPEGFGFESHPDGTEIWGQYHNGVLHGDALIMKADGSRQYANYKDGELDGQVIHTMTNAPLHPRFPTTPSPSLDAPFNYVAQLADQYDALLLDSKRKAKKFAKAIVKESRLAGLPVNASFLDQDRLLMPQGWQEHFKQASRSVTKKTIDEVNSYLASKDPLFAEYAAIYEGYNNKWPSELAMKPQSSFKVASWKNGVKIGEAVISRWSLCTFKNQQARYVPEEDHKTLAWANSLGDMRIKNERWYVPEPICRVGIPDGKGIAISESGRWIITDAVFVNGRLVSGTRQSFASSNVGYAGAIKNGVADGWGYQRDVGPNGKPRYYRGEFKDGKFDGDGHLYTDKEASRGIFVKGKAHGETLVLADKSLEKVTYQNGKKVGPMTKLLVQNFNKTRHSGGEPFFVTVSGNYNKHGRLEGPYKRVREDGLVLFDGTMLLGSASGTLTSVDVSPNPFPIGTIMSRGNPALELYDRNYLEKKEHHTTTAILKNGKVVSMTDMADDGTILYEGSGILWHQFGRRFDDAFAKRVNGRCFYHGRYENCQYLNKPNVEPQRIDAVGKQRRANIIRGSEIRIAQIEERSAARDREEERKKQVRADRRARDKRREREWARERAANKERAQQADRDLVARVYGGGSTSDISSGSRNNLYDPLNPNNPNTKAFNSQVKRTVTDHQRAQKQAEANYNTELATRKAEIEAQKKRQRNAKRSGVTSSSSSSSWDCDRQWRADKCGDRHAVHNINKLSPAYTGGGSANSRNDDGGNSNDGGVNGDGTQTASNTTNTNSHSNTNASSTSGPKMGPLIGEALAICRPKKTDPDLWWCDGPGQKLILADDPLSVQLSAVGCGSADSTNQRLALDDRHYIFFCKYGLQKSDRNIASIYNLPGHILVKRKSYQCKKYNISRCTTLASP